MVRHVDIVYLRIGCTSLLWFPSLECITSTSWDKPELRNVVHDTSPASFKSVKVMNDQETEELLRLEETQCDVGS